jgi:hypothetical protein
MKSFERFSLFFILTFQTTNCYKIGENVKNKRFD